MAQVFKQRITHITQGLKHQSQVFWVRLGKIIDKRPLWSFFGLLGMLLLVIIVGNYFRKPHETPPTPQAAPVTAEIYTTAQTPTMTFSAKIEKSGVINIYAQSQGIVQTIKVKEGQAVKRGGILLSLSSNYQGGSIPSLSRQIAQKNYDFNVENYDVQKDILTKQKDLANKAKTQSSELRAITRQSLDETRGLISLNQDILNRINDQVEMLKSTNVGGSNDNAILGALQSKAMAQSGLNQLQSSLRSMEYQANDGSTGAQMNDLTRDVAIKQLELQEKTLTLTKDISELNVKLARVSEFFMYPATPCRGVVERVYVHVGQLVNPGTLVATITADQGQNTAIVSVTREVAKQISQTEPSYLMAGNQQIKLYPRYISTEATDGNLYSVMYDLSTESDDLLTDAELLQMQIPIGNTAVFGQVVVIPLDAIYQTQDKAYVLVVHKTDDGKLRAKTVEVTLGEVSGSFVQVTKGLVATDQVITSRNIQDGDLVQLP